MLRNKTVSHPALVKELKARVARSSQAAISREIGIQPPLISNVLRGQLLTCGKLLKWLGYKRVVRYEKI
jgi:hypothetical protein